MLPKISQILLRQLQKRGILIKHYASPQKLHKKLSHKPLEVRHYELKKVTDALGSAGHQKIYNDLLQQFVPEWPKTIQKSEFIGSGIGRNSLNTYRKVTLEDGIYFEKIFFTSDPGLQSLTWFYHTLYEPLKGHIKIPKLKMQYRGEILTIVYYEFLKLSPLPKARREKELVNFSKYLYKTSIKLDIKDLKIPDFLKNFAGNHNVYKKNRPMVKTKLAENNWPISVIEERIKTAKHVLTHGDINHRNAFCDKVLIDWDDFGIYPIGFDPALTYYYRLKRNEVHDDFTAWLKVNFAGSIHEEDWADFMRNSVYFLYVFGQSVLFTQNRYSSLEKKLLKSLKLIFKENVRPIS